MRMGMIYPPDGRHAVVNIYKEAYEFSRAKGETWARSFSRQPWIIRAPKRKQEESVCYAPDGKILCLTSEGLSQLLWEIPVLGKSKFIVTY
jgi:hypothetical protein